MDLKNIEMFSNGHTALELAIKSLNLNGEIITTPFTFASKGYSSCTFVITNNTTSSIKVDVHTRAWGSLIETFNLAIGESKTVTISQANWDFETSGGSYGFSLLCYNDNAQTGGTIDVSRPVINK